MEETVEKVTTRIYTRNDIIALLGEGKTNVHISVGMQLQTGGSRWIKVFPLEAEVLKVEIREKYDNPAKGMEKSK